MRFQRNGATDFTCFAEESLISDPQSVERATRGPAIGPGDDLARVVLMVRTSRP